MGSGNIVHNLRDAFRQMRSGVSQTPPWAKRFDETVATMMTQRDTKALLSVAQDTQDGKRAHPSIDHWLPLIYAYATTDERDKTNFPAQGFDLGSISMRNVVFGEHA